MNDYYTETLDSLVTRVDNIFQLKFTNGEEIICAIKNSKQFHKLDYDSDQSRSENMAAKLSADTLTLTWAMGISFITEMEESSFERVSYVFRPWMILQSNIEGAVVVPTNNIIAIYEPSQSIKTEYLDMVARYNKYAEDLKEKMQAKDSSDSDEASSKKVVRLFGRDNKEIE